MKKIVSVIIAVLVLVSSALALADGAVLQWNATNSSAVEWAEYEGRGRVEVDFNRDVKYTDPAVAVTGADGAAYSAVITERDEDDLSFSVEGLLPGAEYNFTITGLTAWDSSELGPVSGSFYVPAEGEVVISKVEYDREDGELDLEFSGRVEFSDVSATVEDLNGNQYEVKILEKDNDGLELRVKGLTLGSSYRISVNGVGAAGSGSYGTLTRVFTAADN